MWLLVTSLRRKVAPFALTVGDGGVGVLAVEVETLDGHVVGAAGDPEAALDVASSSPKRVRVISGRSIHGAGVEAAVEAAGLAALERVDEALDCPAPGEATASQSVSARP